VAGLILDIHTMLYAAAAVIVGLQAVSLALFARVFGSVAGFLPESDRLKRLLVNVNLERGLVAGIALVLLGVVLSLQAVYRWGETSFGDLDPTQTMRITIPAFTALVAGLQIILSAFFYSVLEIPVRRTGN
jgi:hypothetical protein